MNRRLLFAVAVGLLGAVVAVFPRTTPLPERPALFVGTAVYLVGVTMAVRDAHR